MFYVLNASPLESRSWVLNLDGYPKRDDAERAINWQVTGGAPRGDFCVCTYDRRANCFPGVERPDVRWQPDRGPYTAEAWAAFCERLGYDPDGEPRELRAKRER